VRRLIPIPWKETLRAASTTHTKEFDEILEAHNAYPVQLACQMIESPQKLNNDQTPDDRYPNNQNPARRKKGEYNTLENLPVHRLRRQRRSRKRNHKQGRGSRKQQQQQRRRQPWGLIEAQEAPAAPSEGQPGSPTRRRQPRSRSLDRNHRLTQRTIHQSTNTQQPNLSWGDSVLNKKTDDALQIYTRNILGIFTSNNNDKAKLIATALYSKDVNKMGLSETNVDWKQAEVALDMASAFNQKFGAVPMNFDLQPQTAHQPPEPSQSLQARRNSTSGNVRRIEKEDFTNPLGNFLSALTIVMAYRVVLASRAHAGTQTANQQQHNILRQTERHPEPRNQVLKDLKKFIGDKQLVGNTVIQLIDTNESTNCRNSTIKKLREDLQLIEVQLIDLHRKNQKPANNTLAAVGLTSYSAARESQKQRCKQGSVALKCTAKGTPQIIEGCSWTLTLNGY
jgi:hypothetical protein